MQNAKSENAVKTKATIACGCRSFVRLALAATCLGFVQKSQAIISHWDFSSDAQGEVDITGKYDLTNGGVSMSDGAAVFDGSAKRLCTRHPIAFDTGSQYTIECFVKASQSHDGVILELGSNYYNAPNRIMLLASQGVSARVDNGYNVSKFDSNICDGSWHHVAVVVSPAGATVADQLKLYVDHTLQSSVEVHGNAKVALGEEILYIGSRNGSQFSFNGQIDDVRVTEGALATSEFMQARTTRTGLDVRALWPFDSASPLADVSGNGNTLQGGAAQGVSFANGYAAFNGTASDVRTTGTLDLSAIKDVTVECFVRKHEGADALGILVEHSGNYWTNPQGFYLALNNERVGNVNTEFKFTGGNGRRSVNSPQYSVNAGWHHVAVVKDSAKANTGDCLMLYIDGIAQTEYANTALTSDELMRNDYLYIGSRANSSLFLNADVDDVRVTAQALMPGQFLKTRSGTVPDVVAYWPFKKGKMLVDASGNGNALVGSGVTVSDDGSAVFDGAQSGYASLAPLPLYDYESLTVEWFMKTTMADAGIALEVSPNYNNAPGAFAACVNGTIGYRMLGSGRFNVFANWAVSDGAWHHYALVYDWDYATSDIVRLYRDGVQITARQTSYTAANAAKPRSAVLYIGTRNGNTFPFVGEMDDIRITGRALTPSEFLQKRSTPTGMVIYIL